MTGLPVPESDGASIPAGLGLIRLAIRPDPSRLSPQLVARIDAGLAIAPFFELSSEDKKQAVPRLSVWVERLTTIGQAWHLVGANARRNWVLALNADDIRGVFAEADDKNPPTPRLDVQWERAMVIDPSGLGVPEMRPGWEGHAGVCNLDKGNKTQREWVRRQLADLATVRILTPEEIAGFAQE